jgi:hypothetical protein
MTTTEAPTKRAPRVPTVLDGLRSLNRRRAEVGKRLSDVGLEVNGAKARIEQLKAERAAEQREAAQQLRPPDLLSIDERTRAAKAELAGLVEQVQALRAVEAGVDREVLELHEAQRAGFLALAHEGSDLDASEGQQAAKRIRNWLMARRANQTGWRSAWRGLPLRDEHGERDPLRPEVFGGRSDARIPGASLADRVELPSTARHTVNGVELWDVEILAAVVAEALEANTGRPAAIVPPTALQGRPGIYRSAATGRPQRITHRELHGSGVPHSPAPSPLLVDAVRIDGHGCAQLVWVAPLPEEAGEEESS